MVTTSRKYKRVKFDIRKLEPVKDLDIDKLVRMLRNSGFTKDTQVYLLAAWMMALCTEYHKESKDRALEYACDAITGNKQLLKKLIK